MKKFAIVLAVLLGSAAYAVHYVPPVKYGEAFTLHFSIYDSNSPWQFYETKPAADDVYVRKDGGAATRATNAVTDLDHTMSLVLTVTEMTAGCVTVDVNDETAPPLYGSDTWVIYTYGNASAQNAFDLDTATQSVTTTSISNGAITAAAIATGAVDSDALAATALTAIENEILDVVLTGNTHNTNRSVGYYIRRNGGAPEAIWTGTATAGTTNTATLSSTASTTANRYVGSLLVVTTGTGLGQTRPIVGYTAGRVATVVPNWDTIPVNGTGLEIRASSGSVFATEGTAISGTDTTHIGLASNASTQNDIYNGYFIKIISGTGSEQGGIIADYDGGTKVATLETAWVQVSTDSVYVVIPSGTLTTDTPPPTPGLTITDVQSAMTNQGYSSTLATNLGTTNSRIGDPCSAGDTLAADILAIEGMVDALEARLTSTRAGYLDLLTDIGDPNSGDTLAGDLSVIETMVDSLEATVALILADTGAYDTDAEHATAIWNAAFASYGGAGTYGNAVENITGTGTYDLDALYALCLQIRNAQRY